MTCADQDRHRRGAILAEIIRGRQERIAEQALADYQAQAAIGPRTAALEEAEHPLDLMRGAVQLTGDLLAAPDEQASQQARDAFYALFQQRGWLNASRGGPTGFHPSILCLANAIWRSAAPEVARRFDQGADTVAACRELSDCLTELYAAYAQGYVLYEVEMLRARERTVEQLMAELQKAEERERSRIASGLHDGPGQLLVDFHQRMQLCQRLVVEDPGRCLAELQFLQGLAQQGIQDFRQIIHEMRPVRIGDGGLAAALKQYGHVFQRKTGITTQVRATGGKSGLPAGPASLLLLVAQEALANARKHAGATVIQMRLTESRRSVQLRVADNGRGFDAPQARRASRQGQTYGLALMEQRLELLGGRLDVSSRIGEGTVVTATVPSTRTD